MSIEFDPGGAFRSAKAAALVALPVVLPVLVAITAFAPRWLCSPSGLAYAAPARAAKAKQAPQGFEYKVSDCLGPENADSVAMEQTEGSMKFRQILTMNCIAATHPNTVKVAYAKKGSNLEVAVILDSELKSDCTCPIEIDGRISNLAKGNYRLSFVYDCRLGRSEDEKATRTVLGTKEFSVE
jgi:hypothetical protein